MVDSSKRFFIEKGDVLQNTHRLFGRKKGSYGKNFTEDLTNGEE